MERLLSSAAIKWLFLLMFYLLLISTITHAKVYMSCQDVVSQGGSSAVNGYYSIEIAKGIAVSLYCEGMDTPEPKEFLNLPAGKSKNYAWVYSKKGVTSDCRELNPVQVYNESGKSEFEKVRFDTGTTGIILDDFTFSTKIGLHHVKYGTAGDYFTPNKKCQPRGNFRVDLAGTPFVISKKIKWFWKGQFSDGSKDGVAHLDKDLYLGCFTDRKGVRALPSAFMTNARMTVSTCTSHCRYRGFYYAGLQDSQECWCGNTYNKYGPSRACRMRCKGNRREICGGPWALSVYVVGTPQFMMGRCGGYPGHCYPAQKQDKELLLLSINPRHPCYHSVCGVFAKCLAIDTMGYKCLCPKGFVGRNCEKRAEIIAKNGICPPKYQPEVCRCDAANCHGAKFQNGKCVTLDGKPQVVCRYGDPSHININTVTSIHHYGRVNCGFGRKPISCSYWDPRKRVRGNGVSGTKIIHNSCTYYGCKGCALQISCLKVMCGCKNGGICDMESQQCHCRPGYTGLLCENYDYCSFWEKSHKKAACEGGGVCISVPKLVVSTIGGDQAGDRCLFPFKYQGKTFSRCVSDNKVGPPFACATAFNGRRSYIDLGKWSPGPIYSILAWVKPTLKDSKHRLIVGSIADCRDFGLGFQYGRFQTYYAARGGDKCTIPMSTHNQQAEINQWHAVAVINTGHRITLLVNGRILATSITYSHFLGNSKGFFVGGGGHNYDNVDTFKGSVKNLRIYNKALDHRALDKIFENGSVDDSIDEIKRGLVGYYELGEKLPEKCNGIDHGFQDWIPETLSQISGIHCNITKFIIPQGTKVFVSRWSGASNGSLEVTANEILIQGELTAAGAGYHGGKPSNANGADGNQGESHSDTGEAGVHGNRGGGGGGLGEKNFVQGGLPGGGGGHGTAGSAGISKITKQGNGAGGAVYGTNELHHMYIGSGGGSGGNAIDLTETPPGGAGGNGGGAIKLYADTQVIITGSVSVQGEDGIGDPNADKLICPEKCKSQGSCSSTSSSACWDKSGPGGGGSGGSIFISGEFVNIGVNRLFTMGGTGGQGAYMRGGNGGMGRLTVQSSEMVGSLDRRYGFIKRSARNDKIVDFSNIGKTIGNDGIPVNTNPVYLGCIKETKDFLMKHKLNLSPKDASHLTPLSCHNLCGQAGHVYSGTTKGNQCFCDDQVTTSSYSADKECNIPCPGDRRQFCGSNGNVLVFGPKPTAYATRSIGAKTQCDSWCVTADPDAPKPKWGQCVDEESTLAMGVACECPSGKTGDDCTDDCPQGTWGVDCRNNCTCHGHPCDASNGNCNCTQGFQGHTCARKKCPPKRAGIKCNMCLIRGHYGKDCKKCNCGRSNCNVITGKCHCETGRMGENCEKVCPIGKWGHGCHRTCNCRNNGTCEPIFGMCNCRDGYTGRNCDERCPAGTFGNRCGSSCPVCRTDTCHHVTGNCLCNSGYKGANCTETCSSDSWGVGCANLCEPNCKNGCNPMEGFCCSKPCCADDQYCGKNGTCIGKCNGGIKVIPVKSASMSVGAIVGIVLVIILIILCGIVGVLYFFMGRKMFDLTVAKYRTQKDDVVIEGNFENPFYDQMNDACKPDNNPTALNTPENNIVD